MRDTGLQAVLFDWDGTLVNTAEASYRCYEKLFGSYAIPFDRAAFQRTYSPNWHLTYTALGLPRERWTEAEFHYSSLSEVKLGWAGAPSDDLRRASACASTS